MNKLKELIRNNIWTALDDYFRHADSDDVYENISEEFVERLASDSINSKRALRQLFCQSQGWNESLQAIVINGTKTHNPDYNLVHDLASSILYSAKMDADCDKINLIERAICFFSRPNDKNDYYIDAINQLRITNDLHQPGLSLGRQDSHSPPPSTPISNGGWCQSCD